MTKGEKRALLRKGEKLVRLAYDLEQDAAAVRYMKAGCDSEANGIAALASEAGKIGRSLIDVAERG